MLANPELGLSEDQGWWNITVRRVAAAQKIGPNLPKVQGLITTGQRNPGTSQTPRILLLLMFNLASLLSTHSPFLQLDTVL